MVYLGKKFQWKTPQHSGSNRDQAGQWAGYSYFGVARKWKNVNLICNILWMKIRKCLDFLSIGIPECNLHFFLTGHSSELRMHFWIPQSNQIYLVTFKCLTLTQASFLQKNQTLQNVFLISLTLR